MIDRSPHKLRSTKITDGRIEENRKHNILYQNLVKKVS
eukprot:SAG11_NODE_4921_length_1722_cov_1.110906_3_plen_37_part_01